MKSRLEKELDQLEEMYKEQKEKLEQEIIEENKNNIPKDLRNIAEFLHENLCKYNHTEECDWYYDKGDWNNYSRTKYLNTAKKIKELDNFSFEFFEKIVLILKSF